MGEPTFKEGFGAGVEISKNFERLVKIALEDLYVSDKCVIHDAKDCGCWVIEMKKAVDALDVDRDKGWDIPEGKRILEIVPLGDRPNHVLKGTKDGYLWLLRTIIRHLMTEEKIRECFVDEEDGRNYVLVVKAYVRN